MGISEQPDDDRDYTVFRAEYWAPYGEAVLIVVFGTFGDGGRGLSEWYLLLPDHPDQYGGARALRYDTALQEFGWDLEAARTDALALGRRALIEHVMEGQTGEHPPRVSEFVEIGGAGLVGLFFRGRCKDALRRIREKTACPRLSRDIYLLSSRTLVGPSDVDLWGEEA